MINLLMCLGLLIIMVGLDKPKPSKLCTLLILGGIAGGFMDYWLGYRLGWWYYVSHKFFTTDYFINLIPAWSMVIPIFTLFYSLLKRSIQNNHVRNLIYYGIICGQQEFMGVWRHSWEYNVPLPLILMGWIILLELIVLLNDLLDWFAKESFEITVVNLEGKLN